MNPGKRTRVPVPGRRIAGMKLNLEASLLSLVVLGVQAQDNEAAWKETIQNVIPSVVTIRANKTRPFDTESNTLLDGTGFVIDAELGIILTNRHIASTGPVRADALFANQEEIALSRIYADPVHDFGFFHYDPGSLRYIRPSGLPLAPEGAQIGREIRVIGNDAGERFSILAGTIAQLDRAAPNYGFGRYNHFNTFYLQAASSTSGGSSGSPVIDIQGQAVALNVGGQRQATTSYFLPLNRVQRALEFIRRDQPVPRGGLLTTFEQFPYDGLRRLGLSEETEADARAADPERAGLLVVRSTVKDSPASVRLRPGDILVRIKGTAFPDFVRLERVLDDNVGRAVKLAVERQGRLLELSIEVADLHRVTPSEYITFGNAILHQTSYQQARHFNVPLNTIYVAFNGYMLGRAEIETGSILHEIDGRALEDLDDVEEALAGLRHEDIAQFLFSNPRISPIRELRSARISRRWFKAERCRQGTVSQDWSCSTLAAAPPRPAQPRTAPTRKFGDGRLERIASSLVYVTFDMPFPVSGADPGRHFGAGLIVDAKRGWVVVVRNTVPETIGDVVLTFSGTMEVMAEVTHIHPIHNLALLKYDPTLLGGTQVREATFAPSVPRAGEEILLAGFRPNSDLVFRSYEAGDLRLVDTASNPLGAYRESNLEILEVNNADASISGVLLDSKGRVSGLSSSFHSGSDQQIRLSGGIANVQKLTSAGLPIEHVEMMLDHLRRDVPWHSLEVAWRNIPLSVALARGLPEDWRTQLQQHDPEGLRMLTVGRTVAGTPAAGAMRPGDLLLSVNGRLATRPLEVERAVAGRPEAKVLVWRNRQEVELKFDTVEIGWDGLREVLFWAGALLQNPQRGMAAQMGIEPQGVSIQQFTVASPAHRYLHPLRCLQITRVNDMATPNLRAFAEVLRQARGAGSVRVEGITDTGAPVFGTVKLDPEYWPSDTLRHGADGWKRLRFRQ